MTDEEASAAYGGDFTAIEAAVMETPRGRWFLGEFARRNRLAETEALLAAIRRLEQSAPAGGKPESPDQLGPGLARMAEAVGRAKASLAEFGSGFDRDPPPEPGEIFSRIPEMARAATSDILKATERVQEAAWALRDGGAAPELCDELDAGATRIYTACAFQDLTAERIRAVTEALRLVDEHLEGAAGDRRSPTETSEAAPPGAEETATGEPVPVGEPPSGPTCAHPELAEMKPPDHIEAAEEAPIAPLTIPSPGMSSPPASLAHEPRTGPLDQLLAIERLDFRARLRLFT